MPTSLPLVLLTNIDVYSFSEMKLIIFYKNPISTHLNENDIIDIGLILDEIIDTFKKDG